MTTAMKRQGRHTHTYSSRYFWPHSCLFSYICTVLNGKCRTHTNITHASRKKCPAWIAICFPVSYTHLDVYKRQPNTYISNRYSWPPNKSPCFVTSQKYFLFYLNYIFLYHNVSVTYCVRHLLSLRGIDFLDTVVVRCL